jgi:hypothetical protein
MGLVQVSSSVFLKETPACEPGIVVVIPDESPFDSRSSLGSVANRFSVAKSAVGLAAWARAPAYSRAARWARG